MRVFLAGASGVIGVRLIPLLSTSGHIIAGMSRSPTKADLLEHLGAIPVICDAFDRSALKAAVAEFAPDIVVHQLTDLPDDAALVTRFALNNERIRREGTSNLIAAAEAAGSPAFLAQSLAWRPPAGGASIGEHEYAVLGYGGTVVRYGQFYGPGTYYPVRPPTHPRVHVDQAARATVALLAAPGGIVVVEGSNDEAGNPSPTGSFSDDHESFSRRGT